jgi:hypothetical protein
MKQCKWLAMICAAMTLAAANNGFAQVKNFEGASVYASTGYESWSTDVSNLSASSLYTWDTFKPSAVPLNIGFDYTWALGEKNTLGIGVETNLLKSSTTTGNQYLSGAYSDSVSVQMDSYYDISMAPGFLISKDTLLYGKLGYYSVKVNADSEGYTQTGYSYGFGAKTLFNTGAGSKNYYFFGELKSRAGNTIKQTVSGSSGYTFDMKAGGTSFLMGVGMNF